MAKNKKENYAISGGELIQVRTLMDRLKSNGYTAKDILIAVIPRRDPEKTEYIKCAEEIIKEIKIL